MINQACHVSFVRGINNNFLADFEKLCSKKGSIDVVMLDEISEDAVISHHKCIVIYMAHVSNAMPIFDMHIKAEEWRIRHGTFCTATP